MTSLSNEYRERWQRVQHPVSWADRFLRKAEVRHFLGSEPDDAPKRALGIYHTAEGRHLLFFEGNKLPGVMQTLVWQGCTAFAWRGGCNVMAEAVVDMGPTNNNFALLPMSKGLQLYGIDLPVKIVHTSISDGRWKCTFLAHAYLYPQLADGQD